MKFKALLTAPLVALALAAATATPAQAAATWTTQESTPYEYQSNPKHCGRSTPDNCPWNVATIKDINGVPKNGKIMTGYYSLNSPGIRTALVDAVKKRNVDLTVLGWRFNGGDQESDGNDPEGEYLQLLKDLKGNKKFHYKTCKGSCRRSGTTGIHHDGKSITFSAVGSTKYVVRINSGNWTWATDEAGWNTGIRLISKPIYDAWNACLKSSMADKNLGDCKNGTDGKISTNFLPRKDARDFAYTELKKSTGGKGCHIDYAQYKFTNNRLFVLDELIRIRKSKGGCWIRLATNNRYSNNTSSWEKKIKQMQAAGIEVYNGNQFPDGAKGPNYYIHDKRLDVRAYQNGKLVDAEITGTATESYSAYNNNDETQLRIADAGQTQREFNRFSYMKSRGALTTMKF